MKGILLYYLKVFAFCKKGSVIIMSVSVATIISFIEKYIYSDWQFGTSLISLIVIDTLLAIYVAIKKKIPITSKKFSQVLEKFVVYFSILAMVKILMSFTVGGNEVKIFNWVDVLICSFFIVRESISILEKGIEINEKLVPKWILEKLKGFAEDGKFDNLKNPNETNS